MLSSLLQILRRERLGLVMVFAALAAMVLILALVYADQQRDRLEQIREHGASLAQVLSGVPVAELGDRADPYGPLEMLRMSQSDNDFAYAALTGADGGLLNLVNAPGLELDGAFAGAAPHAWAGERSFALANSAAEYIEFHAPVLDGGQLAGNVRIGFTRDAAGLPSGDLPFFATLALLIFLPAPLFYFFVSREIRPLHKANENISRMLDDEPVAGQSPAAGELREFIGRFNEFISQARERISQLESNNAELMTSQKLLSFRKLRIESILRAVPEAILVLDESGTVTFANAMAESLLNTGAEDMTGKPPSAWCTHPEVLGFLQRFESGEAATLFEDTLRFTDNRVTGRSLSIKAYPLYNSAGDTTMFGRLVIIRDGTREAMAEESRVNFIAHVAHEMKTPLSNFSMYAESLQAQGNDKALRAEICSAIRDETERAAALIDNLLSITRIESGNLTVNRQHVRMRDLLEDTFRHLTGKHPETRDRFTLDVPDELSSMSVDKELMRIAVTNLLTNAIKYGGDGEVTLEAEETETALMIRVTDQGIGIAEPDQARIFNKFFRADDEAVRQANGHGLGLPLAREIVELHRGQIRVSSQPGKGSTFEIVLNKDAGLMKRAVGA